MNVCSVCRNPDRREIDRALLSFSPSLRQIAETFGFPDHTCLYRHLSNCLQQEVALARREQAELTCTSIQEITGTLTQIMRGRMTDLFDGHGRFDIKDIEARGLGGLIKSVTIEQKREPVRASRKGKPKPPADIIRVEMYGRDAAAKALLSAWTKLKLNDDANRRVSAMRAVAQQSLDEFMNAGLSFDKALAEVENALPGARLLLNG